MSWVLLGLGLVFVLEGLVLALLPNRIEDLMEMIRALPPEARRTIGLAAVAFGVVLVWIARTLGG